jgi:long-subunit acyl-CoA synthetase (AMP-forming)
MKIHYASLYLGIIGSGGVFSGANPGYTAFELAHHLRITNAKYILTSSKTLGIAMRAAKECGIAPSRVYILNFQGEEIPAEHQSWTELLHSGEKDWIRVEDPDKTLAAFVSTSGTSGLPKAASSSHSYAISQAKFRESIASENASQLIAIPAFHVFTIPSQHALPLRTGQPSYIMARYDEEGFLAALQQFKITEVIIVPPILMALSKCSDIEPLQSIRRIFVGGSSATDGMQQQFYTKLHPEAKIRQVYGMTEAGWITTWQKPERDLTGSVGQPLPGNVLR